MLVSVLEDILTVGKLPYQHNYVYMEILLQINNKNNYKKRIKIQN